jgi:hypothetical protein
MTDPVGNGAAIPRRLLAGLLSAATLPRPGSAQAPPALAPGDRMVFPSITVTVLGLSVERGSALTIVKLRLRAQTGPDRTGEIRSDQFRMLAADVPRAPFNVSSENIPRDAAIDFNVQFNLPDRTDDLVLRIRVDGATEYRRLPSG